MPDYKCLHCNSEQIQKATVIHAHGTTKGSSMSGGSFGGRPGLVGTSTTSQTELAKKLSPPPRMGYGRMLFGILSMLICVFFILAGFSSGPAGVGFIGLITFIILSIILVNGIKNNLAYSSRYQEYDRIWFCHKCGQTSKI